MTSDFYILGLRAKMGAGLSLLNDLTVIQASQVCESYSFIVLGAL